MCALFGLIDYKGVLSHKEKMKILAVLCTECEERGQDASGISFIHRKKLCIYKRPRPASKLRFYIGKNSRVIMAHTRMTTQGNENYNANNHPFSGKVSGIPFALAHNGIIYNDTELQEAENLAKTTIKTDSYVIVQMIEKSGILNFSTLKQVSEKLEGTFTYTVLDVHENLYFVKGNNPLCIYSFKDFYLYASTERILKKALKKLHLTYPLCKSIELSCGDILKIAPSGKTELGRFDTSQIARESFYASFHPYYDKYDWDCAFYQEDLIDIAKCHDIPEEDVRFLLDCGYDRFTIEELLYEPDLLKKCMEEELLCNHLL